MQKDFFTEKKFTLVTLAISCAKNISTLYVQIKMYIITHNHKRQIILVKAICSICRQAYISKQVNYNSPCDSQTTTRPLVGRDEYY